MKSIVLLSHGILIVENFRVINTIFINEIALYMRLVVFYADPKSLIDVLFNIDIPEKNFNTLIIDSQNL
jgi:hypothetical protein